MNSKINKRTCLPIISEGAGPDYGINKQADLAIVHFLQHIKKFNKLFSVFSLVWVTI